MTATPAPATVTLYSRHEHGGHPVRVVGESAYEVDWPTGTQRYGSRRALLRAIYSGGDGSLCARDPGTTFERYFRLADARPLTGGFADLFLGGQRSIESDPARIARRAQTRLTTARRSSLRSRAKLIVEAPWWDGKVVVGGMTRELPVGSWSRGLVISESKTRRLPQRRPKLTVEITAPKQEALNRAPAPDGHTVLGIDLAARGHEVKKLLYACFGARMSRLGLDPAEVLQEVYMGLLARNAGRCPWDASKSSFGHYVHMVISCVLSNYSRKQRRISKHEQVGVYTATDDGWNMVDAAVVAADEADGCESVEESTAEDMAMGSLEEWLMDCDRPESVIAVLALPHVNAGCTRRMISERISAEIGESVSPAEVGKALTFLRKEAKVWAGEVGA